jgi:hypothetical protein
MSMLLVMVAKSGLVSKATDCVKDDKIRLFMESGKVKLSGL